MQVDGLFPAIAICFFISLTQSSVIASS